MACTGCARAEGLANRTCRQQQALQWCTHSVCLTRALGKDITVFSGLWFTNCKYLKVQSLRCGDTLRCGLYRTLFLEGRSRDEYFECQHVLMRICIQYKLLSGPIKRAFVNLSFVRESKLTVGLVGYTLLKIESANTKKRGDRTGRLLQLSV